MAWSLDIDHDARHGGRTKLLSTISGEIIPATLGRLAYIWDGCIEACSEIRTAKQIDAYASWWNPQRGHYVDMMVNADLAEKIGVDQYRIKGVAEKMAWLLELRTGCSNAGKTSVKDRPRDKNGRLLPKKHGSGDVTPATNAPPTPVGESLDNHQRTTNAPPTDTNPLTLTLSLTTQNEESIGSNAVASVPPKLSVVGKKPRFSEECRQKSHAFIGAYVKAYQTRFKTGRPEDLNDGKTQGQILAWVKEYPLLRACQLVQVYFQMDTKWFNQKGYDFITFRNNLNKIGRALDSGQDPDGTQIDFSAVWSETAAVVG